MRPRSRGTSPVGETPLAHRLLPFLDSVGIGKTKGYEEIRSGRLRVVKCGRRTLVTHKAALEYIALLEHEAGHGDRDLTKEVGRDP
jgi:hypothetical protein